MKGKEESNELQANWDAAVRKGKDTLPIRTFNKRFALRYQAGLNNTWLLPEQWAILTTPFGCSQLRP